MTDACMRHSDVYILNFTAWPSMQCKSLQSLQTKLAHALDAQLSGVKRSKLIRKSLLVIVNPHMPLGPTGKSNVTLRGIIATQFQRPAAFVVTAFVIGQETCWQSLACCMGTVWACVETQKLMVPASRQASFACQRNGTLDVKHALKAYCSCTVPALCHRTVPGQSCSSGIANFAEDKGQLPTSEAAPQAAVDHGNGFALVSFD